MLHHPTVVNAQELVGTSSHVDKVWLAFGPFFIQEEIHGVIHRLFFD